MQPWHANWPTCVCHSSNGFSLICSPRSAMACVWACEHNEKERMRHSKRAFATRRTKSRYPHCETCIANLKCTFIMLSPARTCVGPCRHALALSKIEFGRFIDSLKEPHHHRQIVISWWCVVVKWKRSKNAVSIKWRTFVQHTDIWILIFVIALWHLLWQELWQDVKDPETFFVPLSLSNPMTIPWRVLWQFF